MLGRAKSTESYTRKVKIVKNKRYSPDFTGLSSPPIKEEETLENSSLENLQQQLQFLTTTKTS